MTKTFDELDEKVSAEAKRLDALLQRFDLSMDHVGDLERAIEEVRARASSALSVAENLEDVDRRLSQRLARLDRFYDEVADSKDTVADQLVTKAYLDAALARFSNAVHKRIDRELAAIAQKKSKLLARVRAVIAAALGKSPGLPANVRTHAPMPHINGVS
jgi:hypothetical protein